MFLVPCLLKQTCNTGGVLNGLSETIKNCVEAAAFTKFVSSVQALWYILVGFLYSKVIQCLLSFKGILAIWDFWQTVWRPPWASRVDTEKCSYLVINEWYWLCGYLTTILGLKSIGSANSSLVLYCMGCLLGSLLILCFYYFSYADRCGYHSGR